MKEKNPLVTVYITNYNYGRYIKSAIESVLFQTLNDFELLIIDDGSVDNSKEVIEQFRSHPNISIIYQQNKGLNITNNVAMRAAQGKYLVRLDADDFLEPDALERMVDLLERDDKLGLVFPDYYYVDGDGNRTGEERRHNFDKEVSLFDQPAHGACTMIRLDFLKRLGGYNESFTCQDGYDLWIKFVTHYKVTNINKPLFSYRRHGYNLTENEGKILSTRQAIKDTFVRQHYQIPNTLAIIPVRNTFIDGKNWPTHEIHGKSILEDKIETCLKAKNIKHVVVSTSDVEILDFYRSKFVDWENVSIVERPKMFEEPNQSLSNTIEQAIQFVESQNNMKVEALMTVSLEYPFLQAEVINETINTLVLFNADSVLTVRPDTRKYYQHVGNGMKPILDQDKFTKLEREALYKGAGGVMLITRAEFDKTKQSLSGNVSHVVVDIKQSFGVFGKFELELFEAYLNTK